MTKIVVDSLNIVTALGSGVVVNFEQMLMGVSGVKLHDEPSIDSNPVWASLVNEAMLGKNAGEQYTRYEKLLLSSITGAQLQSTVDLSSNETIFIFSTTKGNISLLETEPVTPELMERISLYHSATLVSTHFGNTNRPVVISNACISGVVALLYARRLLLAGKYRNAVVAGADTISKFVYSGFQSFQALSPGLCKPFSASRDGINLGEAGATLILSATEEISNDGNHIHVGEGSVSNDSNHISGPSRTGAELSAVINKSIASSGLTAGDIDFISAHGTATPFNDEMEAKAFHLSGLANVPVNSLKGYFGHTLGAAGLVESAISMQSLLAGQGLPSLGYQEPCVHPDLNIITTPLNKSMKHCLKTASGFGGCNAAIVFSKN